MRFIILAILFSTSLLAQIPNGYYDSASGQIGSTLQQTLHDIIDDHTVVSYSSLWTHYQTTDDKPNGKVWDMYSDIPDGTPPYEFTFVEDQCGNYSGEGSCYNREHSWPKSWFNDDPPMNTDIFHVVPSDGYVNGQRGNYPYGEVDNPTWTSLNGSKRGPNTYPGYSGTVFEPIDAYKGDFARIYFYMSTRYLNEDTGWPGSPMVDGAQLEPWALEMMMEWHEADPVSQKEIDRNNDIYNIQNNRNPFVDHPVYVDLIWGDPPEIPEAPSDLSAGDISETVIPLFWTVNSDNETGIYVYQNADRIATLGPGVNDYVVDQLDPGTTYQFAVSAFNADGESQWAEYVATTLSNDDSTVTHFEEDFESAGGSSYIDGDFTLNSGSWSAYQAGNFTLGNPRSGSKSVALNDDKPGAHITIPAVNSLGTLSFYFYQRNGAATDEFTIEKSINGAAFEFVTSQSYNVGETYTLFTTQVNDTSSSVRVRIVNDNQSGHLIIDDLTVTQYEPVSIENGHQTLPDQITLFPAYPNPFNPEVSVRFQIADHTQDVTLEVFDLNGRPMAMLARGEFRTGIHLVNWFPSDVPAGVYLLRLSNGSMTQLQRITLLK